MKFQPDRMDGVNAIQGHDERGLRINGQLWSTNVLIPATGEVLPWACARFEELATAHLELVLPLQPELVILGTGRRQRFASPAITRVLLERRIGVECMDTAAACRTYNILVSEGRRAVALMLLD